ncbi:class I SAM-dependent methyltransferase [Erythrobacter aureus]|uniref:Class I SAM-dependent methyltransferase n=1 Tax=Erythrobacter aureus TaxID=2182384 RepID=A0A345YJM3_9SPHN|nr:class I SAM-dependent methyltransferase [Erythrobacter aureus]AXK44125.1 class I SAM-dependent methyltransferase [Erythrobacter aureus]
MHPDLFAAPAQAEPKATDDRSGDAALSQWFTPFWVAEELVDDALRGIGHSCSVIEPSCGTGAFLTAIPKSCGALGIDIDPSVVPAAIANSGREVLVGDFRTIDLQGREAEVILGNPPFEMDVVDGFLDRAHEMLPEDGLVAMVLPAYAFQTPSRVSNWMERFSIDVNMIPRTLFPGLSKPLVWAKYIKQSQRRFSGLMLFAETRQIENMRPAIREALARPGTWREAVAIALHSLGGQASVQAIYDAIAPERTRTDHWKPKIRQTLQRGFRSLGNGRWELPREYLAAA